MNLGTTIVQALYFFLPAYVSNMAPVALGKLNIFRTPVDFNKTYNDKPIFGKHTTGGGRIYGTVAGTLMFIVQQKLYTNSFFKTISIIEYPQWSIALGILLAAGAILGDLAKSFIKRRLNKESGSPWFPFDQLDFVIGGLLFASPLIIPHGGIIFILIVLTPILHYGANYLGFYLRLKRVKW